MKVSAIDIGTNSIRLLNTEIVDRQITSGVKQLEMTRIGEGVNETGRLSPAAVERSVSALKVFVEQARAFGAEHIHVMATSAVRDASNRHEFLERVRRDIGVEIEVLSGNEEAEIGYLGVLAGMESTEDKVLVIDVGGGSTELIVGDRQHILFRQSLDIGAVRMTGKYIESDPPSKGEVKAVLNDIRDNLHTVLDQIKEASPVKAIGIGGTATTLGAIHLNMEIYDRERIQNCQVTLEKIDHMIDLFRQMPLAERQEIPGLQPKRADIILAGALIVEEMLKEIGMDSLYISDWDNLEGYLMKKHLRT